MGKPTKTEANKPKPQAARKVPVVRGAAAIQKQADANPGTALYPVLEPFKFKGHIVKPPQLIELSAAEAQQYWDAEVLGTEPHEVPDTHTSEQSGGQDAQSANGATDGT